MTRDPRTDPQPGDKMVTAAGEVRTVLRRDSETLSCQDGVMHYSVTLRRWTVWCEKNSAMPGSPGERPDLSFDNAPLSQAWAGLARTANDESGEGSRQLFRDRIVARKRSRTRRR